MKSPREKNWFILPGIIADCLADVEQEKPMRVAQKKCVPCLEQGTLGSMSRR